MKQWVGVASLAPAKSPGHPYSAPSIGLFSGDIDMTSSPTSYGEGHDQDFNLALTDGFAQPLDALGTAAAAALTDAGSGLPEVDADAASAAAADDTDFQLMGIPEDLFSEAVVHDPPETSWEPLAKKPKM